MIQGHFAVFFSSDDIFNHSSQKRPQSYTGGMNKLTIARKERNLIQRETAENFFELQ